LAVPVATEDSAKERERNQPDNSPQWTIRGMGSALALHVDPFRF